VRWGAQAKPGKVDLGLKELVDYPHRLQGKRPALFQVVKTTPRLRLEVVEREEIEEYYGFEAEKVDSLGTFLKDSVGVTRIALSRHAPPYSKLEGEIKSTVAGTKSLLAIFGGPRHGVSELLSKEKDPLKEHIDFWVNTVPQQGTETVRLEEAILTSLTLLNNAIGNLVAKPGYYQ
jgi:predicted SPOUT superfamily RNA methylase MTH1